MSRSKKRGKTGPARDKPGAPEAEPAIWFFGYGSLMWNPDFVYARREAALLKGYHRVFTGMSTNNRGTPEEPGMMMGLVPGGECTGVAYGVTAEQLPAALARVDKRESEGRSNRRAMLPVRLLNVPGTVLHNAWTYLPSVTGRNWVGVLPQEEMLPYFNSRGGKAGTSYEYLCQTLAEVKKMGAREPGLETLRKAVEQHRRENGNAKPALRKDAGN